MLGAPFTNIIKCCSLNPIAMALPLIAKFIGWTSVFVSLAAIVLMCLNNYSSDAESRTNEPMNLNISLFTFWRQAAWSSIRMLLATVRSPCLLRLYDACDQGWITFSVQR